MSKVVIFLAYIRKFFDDLFFKESPNFFPRISNKASPAYYFLPFSKNNFLDFTDLKTVMIFNQFTLIACWLLAQLYNCKLFVVCCLYSLSLFILSHW